MDLAWRDHHHARNQTWKVLEIEAALAAGLVGVDWQLNTAVATICAAVLVMLSTMVGVWISLHHRKLEIRKFEHISNCEEHLGLLGPKLLPYESVKPPTPIKFRQVFDRQCRNTAAFILRMHVALFLFAAIFLLVRLAGLIIK